jgi:hypothetical protein
MKGFESLYTIMQRACQKRLGRSTCIPRRPPLPLGPIAEYGKEKLAPIFIEKGLIPLNVWAIDMGHFWPSDNPRFIITKKKKAVPP